MEGYVYYLIGAIIIALGRIVWTIGRTIVERVAVKEALKDVPPEQRAKIIHELAQFRASGQRNFSWGYHKGAVARGGRRSKNVELENGNDISSPYRS